MPRKLPTPKKLPYKGWSPLIHGVSQSLLQKFVVDTDRFHKATVLGMRETTRKEAMEYGSVFHKLIEIGATMPNYTRIKLITFMIDWMRKRYPSVESEFLGQIAVAQYFKYRDWYASKPKYKYIVAEPVFNELYTLPTINFEPNPDIRIRIPSGVKIPLRGRIDGVIDNNGSMWIEENKTKSRVDLSVLQDTIHANIQVMFYAVCSQLKYGRSCNGVIYNVIRKPALRQKVKEPNSEFIKRIEEDIDERPDWYFNRLSYEFQPRHVQRWEREELQPLLARVYLWWRSIEANPLNPWVDANGNPNPFHGRKSFGIYDSMTQGKGDFYDLIVYGRNANIKIVDEQFPELQDDEDE
jgi:hypothetical protein